MKEEFFQSSKFPKEAFQKLHARDNFRGLVRFVVQFTILITCAVLVVLHGKQDAWWTLWLPLLGFSVMTCGMFACLHETGHNTAFSSRGLNKIVAFLSAIVNLYTPSGFRDFHFEHHRYTHHPEKDPEISIAGKPAPGVISSRFMYFGYLTGLPLIMAKSMFIFVAAIPMPEVVWKNTMPYVKKKNRGPMGWEARIVILLNVGIFALGWFGGYTGAYYLFLGYWIGHAILSIYLIPEHNGLPHKGSILERTRTIRTNPLLLYLMWNMPYHAEHHAFPAIPYHALPKLHALLKEHLVNEVDGYPRFHAKVLSGEIKSP